MAHGGRGPRASRPVATEARCARGYWNRQQDRGQECQKEGEKEAKPEKRLFRGKKGRSTCKIYFLPSTEPTSAANCFSLQSPTDHTGDAAVKGQSSGATPSSRPEDEHDPTWKHADKEAMDQMFVKNMEVGIAQLVSAVEVVCVF